MIYSKYILQECVFFSSDKQLLILCLNIIKQLKQEAYSSKQSFLLKYVFQTFEPVNQILPSFIKIVHGLSDVVWWYISYNILCLWFKYSNLIIYNILLQNKLILKKTSIHFLQPTKQTQQLFFQGRDVLWIKSHLFNMKTSKNNNDTNTGLQM